MIFHICFWLFEITLMNLQIRPNELYKCLSDDTRLEIILLIHKCNSLCVCQLVDALKISQPKVSRHLKLLRQAQLVVGHRRKKWVYYQLNPDLPDWVKQVVDITANNHLDHLSGLLNHLAQTSSIELCGE